MKDISKEIWKAAIIISVLIGTLVPVIINFVIDKNEEIKQMQNESDAKIEKSKMYELYLSNK